MKRKTTTEIRKARIRFMNAKNLQEKKEAQYEIRYWTIRDSKAIIEFVRATQ